MCTIVMITRAVTWRVMKEVKKLKKKDNKGESTIDFIDNQKHLKKGCEV